MIGYGRRGAGRHLGLAVPALAQGVLPDGPAAARASSSYAASQLTTIEINGSFYSLQRPDSFRPGTRRRPDDFVFAVKGGRFVTHMKKLRDVEIPLANFFASGVLALGEQARAGALAAAAEPRLRRRAAGGVLRPAAPLDRRGRLAGPRHDERMTGRALTTADADRPLRHALEVRHSSFVTPAFTDAAARAHDRRRRRRHRRPGR